MNILEIIGGYKVLEWLGKSFIAIMTVPIYEERVITKRYITNSSTQGAMPFDGKWTSVKIGEKIEKF